VKPNRIQRKIYPRKSAHTSMSPMPDVLKEHQMRQKERPKNDNPKKGKETK
jgi:hypothetical protein